MTFEQLTQKYYEKYAFRGVWFFSDIGYLEINIVSNCFTRGN